MCYIVVSSLDALHFERRLEVVLALHEVAQHTLTLPLAGKLTSNQQSTHDREQAKGT